MREKLEDFEEPCNWPFVRLRTHHAWASCSGTVTSASGVALSWSERSPGLSGLAEGEAFCHGHATVALGGQA